MSVQPRCSETSSGRRRRAHPRVSSRSSRSAFTLVEMLLVLLIMSMVAMCAVALTNGVDEQLRYEETRRGVEIIRTAVLDSYGNSGQGLRGFTADVGRLPETVQELIEPGRIPLWHFAPHCGQWSGWRGPYIPVQAEHSGLKSFRDGWGNPGGAPNYGWNFAADQAQGTLWVQSFGADWEQGGDDYAADYPATGPLVERHDHQLNLKGWSVRVAFQNPNEEGPAWPASDEKVRVRVYYPHEGRLNWPDHWPASDAQRDRAPYLSMAVILTADEMAGGVTVERNFSFGSEADKLVPCGICTLVVVRDATGESVTAVPQPHVFPAEPRGQLVPVSMNLRLNYEQADTLDSQPPQIARRPPPFAGRRSGRLHRWYSSARGRRP